MYSIIVTNTSSLTWGTSNGQSVKPGATWKSGPLGNEFLHSSFFGSATFVDLGSRHEEGDSGETWGVQISYQGEHVVGRYEGEGVLHVKIDESLQLTVKGMDLHEIAFPAIIIDLGDAG